ncbi:MAG TPA: helix-turn-helix transcriptional regulator [Dehalococcoidales bacterium]|nr:helix-turn-helix transcriptional regulator [Dehalococcoidales bacterium]
MTTTIYNQETYVNKQLVDFLKQQCKQKHLSLRGLSIAAGLSPATVHNVINRQYQPTIFTLNRLADFLGVKREYLWQLAGLLEDMDYGEESQISDPRLKFEFSRADKLPEQARNLIVAVLKTIIDQS